MQDFIEQNPNHPLVDSLSTLVLGTADNSHQKMQANSLAEILFNSDLFSDDAVQNVPDKVTSTVNSYQFNAMALLQCIDCHAASLNDRAVSQYASIGNPRRGEALLVKRWQITDCFAFIDH